MGSERLTKKVNISEVGGGRGRGGYLLGEGWNKEGVFRERNWIRAS